MWREFKSMAIRHLKRALVQRHRRSGIVMFSDTTLRDGEQMPGATLDPHDKLEIALALEQLGVHSLDAGFPASSEQDADAIRMMVGRVHRPVLTALCRTVASDIDAAARALHGQPPHKRGVSMFIGTSPVHREQKLRMTTGQVLTAIRESVRYAARYFHIVAFGPEDASRTEPEFLAQCYEEAIAAGATTVGFADTVGVLTPGQVTEQLAFLQQNVRGIDHVLLAGHFHNDLGLAVANSLASIAAGAQVIQCTIGGIGERAGNAALEEVAVALHLHREEYGVTSRLKLNELTHVCGLVAAKTRLAHALHKPVCGANIFATEAGVHQDGLLKHVDTYLPYQPDLVGAGPITLVLGRHSGRSAVAHRMRELGLPCDQHVLQNALVVLKQLPKGESLSNAALAQIATQSMALQKISNQNKAG